MKIRIGTELQEQLRIVKQNGFGPGEAVSRAARRWERLGRPELAAAGSTYGGTVITVDAPEGMAGDEVRKLLAWYFANWPIRPPRRTAFKTTLREGVDYIVEKIKPDEDSEGEE